MIVSEQDAIKDLSERLIRSSERERTLMFKVTMRDLKIEELQEKIEELKRSHNPNDPKRPPGAQ